MSKIILPELEYVIAAANCGDGTTLCEFAFVSLKGARAYHGPTN